MIDAICSELVLRKAEYPDVIETIYFGGGTPSILPVADIGKILDTISKHYDTGPSAEITLEANPDDITAEKAAAWKSMGINRFSIGIQSFDQQYLQWMNRAHNAKQSLQCIELIRAAGFDNFSIDLIYGTPEQPIGDWIADVQKAVALRIPHLSCYALTVEEGTALHHLISTGKKAQVNTDEQASQFHELLEITNAAGYHHYEISNFAQPGKESRHNSAYWDGVPYLGVGPSAHSFASNTRSWNVAHNVEYIRNIESGIRPFTSEELTPVDALNEYIMTSLRSSKGISKEKLRINWGIEKMLQVERNLAKHLMTGTVITTTTGWKLSETGKFLADGIASDLFLLQNGQ
jgi:oxygen-independent coproporphyrinogen-3 oxidase